MKTLQRARTSASQFLPASLARMFWKRRMMVGAVWVGLTAVAAYIVHGLPNVYRAEAVILVDSQKIPEKFVSSTVQVSLQDSLSGISQQVLNAIRLREIINDFGLYAEERKTQNQEELIARMRKDLTVSLERGITGTRSGAFRISYDGPSQTGVASVVRRVTELFVRENIKNREQRAEGTSQFIDTQLQQAKASLEEQEVTLSKYKIQWAGELPQQEGALLGALSRLQAELQGHQDAINRAQQNKMMLENSLPFAEASLAAAGRAVSQPPPVAIPARAGAPPVANQSAQQVRASDVLRAQLNALRLRYYDDHPEVKHMEAELKQVLAEEARLARLQPPRPVEAATKPSLSPDQSAEQKAAAISPATAREIADLNRERERVSNTKTQLELVAKEIQARQMERDRILRSISEYQARVEKLPVREQQMASLTRDYEISKMNYRSLLDKKISAEMATEMERSSQSERFTIADPATVPSGPVKPKRPLYYGASAVLSLALSLMLALGLELKKNVFLGEWELPSDMRVMGRISRIDLPVSAGVLKNLGIVCVLVEGLSTAIPYFRGGL